MAGSDQDPDRRPRLVAGRPGTRAGYPPVGSAILSSTLVVDHEEHADPSLREGPSLRIALLSYRSKPHCGGQGVYVRHLSRELVALGHPVEVFSGQPYPELDPGVDPDQGAQPGPLPRAGPVPDAATRR